MSEEILIGAESVARRLGISQRGVWRLRDSGRLPAPVTLGRLVRWRARELSEWVSAGCPDCQKTGWTSRLEKSP